MCIVTFTVYELVFLTKYIIRADTPVAESAEEDGSDGLSASELRHRKELEYEEDEGQEEAIVELKHAVLELPNLPTPHSSDGVVSPMPWYM